MQNLFAGLTKGKKILIVLSFLYEIILCASLYPYNQNDSILALTILSLPTILLWSSIWIWGWWILPKHKRLKTNKVKGKTQLAKIVEVKKGRHSYKKFACYLIGSILLFGFSSYIKPYGDMLSAFFKSLAVFCVIVACVIWKKMPSTGEKEKENEQESHSHWGTLFLCLLFIMGGTFLGKQSAEKMNEYEYSKFETFSDLGITTSQIEEILHKQCKTLKDIPDEIKAYFCPCFVQLITDNLKENERDFVNKIKQIAQQNNVKDPIKEGFAYGMKYMNDKLQNDPVVQLKAQKCMDMSIEQIKKAN